MTRQHSQGIVRITTSSSSSSVGKTKTNKTFLVQDEDELQNIYSDSKKKILWRTETSLSDDDDDENNSEAADEDERSSSSSNEGSYSPHSSALMEATPTMDELLKVQQKQQTYTVVRDEKDGSVFVEVEVEQYMLKRQMTPLQERMNALTMIPPPLYCICFLLSSNWMNPSRVVEAYQQNNSADYLTNNICLNWSSSPIFGWLFRNIHAVPPLAVLAYATGVILHAPCSFIYHWKYAHALSPGKRTIHWSRRADQSMLHFCSALTSYATSGSWTFFLVNTLFNADSIYRQFQQEVKPSRNQRRLGVAIVAWTLPILIGGDVELFLKVFSILAFGIFLFVKYPVGGWSHSAFHLVMFPVIPIILQVAVHLPSSQQHLREAAQCYVLSDAGANAMDVVMS